MDKIVVAIDSSDRNQGVFDRALSLGKATKASLLLVHILTEEDADYPVLPTYAYYSVLKDNDRGFVGEFANYQEHSLESLKNLSQKATAMGITTEYIQISGTPGWEICELANNWSADLIVIGSRGLKGLKEMFLGSVSNYVMHHAPCSVFIVRTDTDDNSNELTNETSKANITNEQLTIDN